MEINEETYLEHYGILGMKWGVRRDLDGVSRKTNREARKDAEEFARAKMFYGQGAGTRRKLINASVDAKKKRSESYSRAFDHHLARQDLDTHASKATSERKRTDRREKTSQRAGAIARRLTGEWGTQAAFVALVGSGIAFTRTPRGKQILSQNYNKIRNLINPSAEAWLRSHGIK